MTIEVQSQPEDTTNTTKPAEKLTYHPPSIEVLGQMEELTGSCGYNHDDGWGWSRG